MIALLTTSLAVFLSVIDATKPFNDNTNSKDRYKIIGIYMVILSLSVIGVGYIV